MIPLSIVSLNKPIENEDEVNSSKSLRIPVLLMLGLLFPYKNEFIDLNPKIEVEKLIPE